MYKPVRSVLVVGGGSAGWLTAGLIAAEYRAGLRLTVVESPDVPSIGVGEGTWPSMRETLRKIGVSEADFLLECDASFKQGSKFIAWQTGDDNEFYYHPFSLPHGFFEVNCVPCWQAMHRTLSFAEAVCPQVRISEHGLAPKQLATPEYAAVLNYGYHLDAVKFGRFLRDHCIRNLGVNHVVDHVTRVSGSSDGYIETLGTREHGDLAADLFIDCSGSASMLLGDHFRQSFVSRKSVLFNDRALAVQVPYASESQPVASVTLSTAQPAGWVWDIGLPTRRGVGYVYSSGHRTDARAEEDLRAYLKTCMPEKEANAAELRQLKFEPGHRASFWYKNCVAVGMSAGFIEPLEASALALVEISAAMIRDDMPADRSVMETSAARFNRRFSYRWDRIIDFLKLHYVLSSRRDTEYWRDHQEETNIPDRLRELLRLWHYQVPSRFDFEQPEEIFSYASYQYVLYGMGFDTLSRGVGRNSENFDVASRAIDENLKKTQSLLQGLPSNRELLAGIRKRG